MKSIMSASVGKWRVDDTVGQVRTERALPRHAGSP